MKEASVNVMCSPDAVDPAIPCDDDSIYRLEHILNSLLREAGVGGRVKIETKHCLDRVYRDVRRRIGWEFRLIPL